MNLLLARDSRVGYLGLMVIPASEKAHDLATALRLLQAHPLVFVPSGGDTLEPEAGNPRFYTELAAGMRDGVKRLAPTLDLERRLLRGDKSTKLFFSGHVGSGKSTELNRLAGNPAIRQKFTVITARCEEGQQETLDAWQLLFIMAAAIYQLGEREKLLSSEARWREILRTIYTNSFQDAVPEAGKGKLAVEFPVIKAELELSATRRKQFRAYGETHQSTLLDLLAHIADDVETQLYKKGRPQLLLIIDDLDKVRLEEPQKDLFDTNLSVLFAPKVHTVYTLPSGVKFSARRRELRQNNVHLYPAQIIKKVSDTFDPEQALVATGLGYFRTIVRQRVADGLIEDESVRLAALYSGGVLRDFFYLLRYAIDLAEINGLDHVPAHIMKVAVQEVRLQESVGLFRPDWEALLAIHRSRAIADGQQHFLDLGRVLECENDEAWFSVSPVLWKLLETHANAA